MQAAVADAKRSLETVAKQMPAPLGNIVSEVALRSEAIVSTQARGELARRYAQQVVSECHERVEGFFPLNPNEHRQMPSSRISAGCSGPVGVFDTFYRENLAALVDTSGAQWRWREGAAAGPPGMLQQFQRVQRIRDIYFAPGAHGPEARFSLLADSLDGSVARFTLTVDGQPFEYRYESPQSPADELARDDRGSVVRLRRPRRPSDSGPELSGSLGVVPLARAGAQVERDPQTRFKVTFSAGGKTMRVIMETASVRNPFARNELAGFRCAM